MNLNEDEYDYLLKIGVIGEKSVGKSSILLRFTDNDFCDMISATIGVDLRSKTVLVNNKRVKLQVWDRIDKLNKKSVCPMYYKGFHVLFIVFDKSKRESFRRLKYWVDKVDKDTNRNIVKVIVANKCDLNSELTAEEIQSFSSYHGIDFMETSAKTGKNIENLFMTSALKAIFDMENEQKQKINIIRFQEDRLRWFDGSSICC